MLNYGPYGPDRKAMLVRSDKLELDIRTTMPNDYESLYWVTPLNDEKTQYFETWKTAGIPLDAFEYHYGGKAYKCGVNECFVTTDQFRGYPNYGMNFWFLTVSMVLEDGKTLGIVMQDGIGSEYSGRDRATEDHINLNGKVHKLDQTIVKFDNDNLMNPIRAYTSNETRRFENNSCNLIFSPAHKTNEGVNLFLLALMRDMAYGSATGTCVIEGEEIAIEGAYGLFETLWTRY